MKKLLPIILILFSACTFTKQQKVEKAVKNYLDSTLNDPKSYESVSFGPLFELTMTDSAGNGGFYEILHTYRAKNGFGGVLTKSEYFQYDEKNNSISCCSKLPHAHK